MMELSGPESGPAAQQTVQAPVSVIIRTRDRPGLLLKALGSVAEQDYPNIEVLIVNDGAPLERQQLDAVAAGLKRLRIVETKAPGGRVAAANTGLAEAGGDLLIFLDDDDWFYPDHVGKLASALRSNPERGLAYTGIECKRIDADSGELVLQHSFNQPFNRTALQVRNYIPMHAAMFRRGMLESGARFDEQFELYEDWDFWLQLLEQGDFLYVPGISACYFLGDGSGFGVEGQQGTGQSPQRAALQRILAKWLPRWPVGDVERIIELARKVPQLRQEAHELHMELQKLYRARGEFENRFDDLRKLHRQALDQHERVLQLHREQTRQNSMLLELLESEKRQNENLRGAEARLQAVLNSRSWKLTAPLRGGLTLLKRAWRVAPSLPRRLGTARALLREQGLVFTAKHARRKLQGMPPLDEVGDESGAGVTPGAGGETRLLPRATVRVEPYSLRRIAPGKFEAVAAGLRFPGTDTPLVSVVIPVYNHLELTLACLQSLAEQPQDTSFEVIVVDDASTDRTHEILANCEALRYLRNEENGGFIHSCNRGAQAARGEFLLILNNDTEVLEHWLDPLVELLRERPDAGIAGAKLIYPSGYLQEAGASLRADGSVDMVGLNGDPKDPRYNRVREVDHCSGAAILVRSALFRELGGFDARYAPAYYEDCDLSLKVRAAGYRVLYQPAAEVLHHLSVSTGNLPGGKLAQIERNKALYLERWGAELEASDKVRLLAFYLPQYHPIPENDAWWGKGFTEWTNVTRARPLFAEHRQPQLPGELGFYDLRLSEVMEQQAALAREHGIHGFCFYYYWFDGKRLLETPLERMLASGKPDFPFCVCWANENWTRRWDGREQEVLIEQHYNHDSNVRFIRDLLPVLGDSRYIRVNGRPLLLIYRADLIPGLKEAMVEWRRITREAGVGEVYLAAVESFNGVSDGLQDAFDALVEFPPHARSVPVEQLPGDLDPDFAGRLWNYPASARNFAQREDVDPRLFRTAMPSWDNTARRGAAAHVYLNSSPQYYQQWLQALVNETRQQRMGDERIVFVNAWNEWAEGNHLEPDQRYGRAWLDATRRALGPLAGFTDERSPVRDDDPRMQPGLNLIGHVYAVLGRAEDIRTGARACVEAGIPMLMINRNSGWDIGLRDKHPDYPLFDRVGKQPEYCANLFYLNADEMPRAWEEMGPALFAGRYNIGCFAWELSKYPDAWLPSLDHLDELWVPSEFIRQALLPVTGLPIVQMPFVVEPGEPGPATRADFGLPEDSFLFLFFFDFRSYVSRKNPQAVLDAFFEAFPSADGEAVHLVIKLNGAEDKPRQYERFLEDPRVRDARVTLISEALDDSGIKSLVAMCDSFVSLHRSEGFGRGLAEAMYYGKPVIGTAYSGNMDFMNGDNACLVNYELIPLQEDEYPFWQGQVWADADVSHAAGYMRKLVEEPDYAAGIGARAKDFIRRHHSTRAVGRQQRRRLEELGILPGQAGTVASSQRDNPGDD